MTVGKRKVQYVERNTFGERASAFRVHTKLSLRRRVAAFCDLGVVQLYVLKLYRYVVCCICAVVRRETRAGMLLLTCICGCSQYTTSSSSSPPTHAAAHIYQWCAHTQSIHSLTTTARVRSHSCASTKSCCDRYPNESGSFFMIFIVVPQCSRGRAGRLNERAQYVNREECTATMTTTTPWSQGFFVHTFHAHKCLRATCIRCK